MKRFFFFPKISTLSLSILIGSIVIISNTGCGPKPACGNKHAHMKRMKAVRNMAPSMSK